MQLYLPHASDAGTVRRVLLRQGAAVLVRGAKAVRLRRGFDLPAISLGEFASIVTSDAEQQQPLGIVHLLAGVQRDAARHWNESHPEQSLGLVALELDLSPAGAALLATPTPGGGSRRLRVRPVAKGSIELLPRDSPQPAGGSQAGAVALPSTAAAAEGPWPLTSVHPMHLQVGGYGGQRRWLCVRVGQGCLYRLYPPGCAASEPPCTDFATCLRACPPTHPPTYLRACSPMSVCYARSSAAGSSKRAPAAAAAAAVGSSSSLLSGWPRTFS